MILTLAQLLRFGRLINLLKYIIINTYISFLSFQDWIGRIASAETSPVTIRLEYVLGE